MEINVEIIDIILLVTISFILGVLVTLYVKKTSENIVNLDDSRKIELSKCCTDPKCYSKPPHLRNNCLINKKDAKEELDKEFKQIYSQEEYYKKLDELGIAKNLNNKDIDEKYVAKMNEQIVINPALDKETDTKIRQDDRDEVRGYDVSILASYIN
jgi:hypothetical protein